MVVGWRLEPPGTQAELLPAHVDHQPPRRPRHARRRTPRPSPVDRPPRTQKRADRHRTKAPMPQKTPRKPAQERNCSQRHAVLGRSHSPHELRTFLPKSRRAPARPPTRRAGCSPAVALRSQDTTGPSGTNSRGEGGRLPLRCRASIGSDKRPAGYRLPDVFVADTLDSSQFVHVLYLL